MRVQIVHPNSSQELDGRRWDLERLRWLQRHARIQTEGRALARLVRVSTGALRGRSVPGQLRGRQRRVGMRSAAFVYP